MTHDEHRNPNKDPERQPKESMCRASEHGLSRWSRSGARCAWGLTRTHQVIVISHLPQIAAFADRHVIMVKSETDGRTETTSATVVGDERTDELAMMFDGLPVSEESRANARALLSRVETWKMAATRA